MSPRVEPDTRNVAGRAWPESQERLAEPRKRAGEPHEIERDRQRDADLQAAGLTVARLTWRRLVDEPEAVVAQLARAV